MSLVEVWLDFSFLGCEETSPRAMCEIVESVVVMLPDKQSVIRWDWQEVDGIRFVKLKKSENYVSKLLTGKGIGKRRIPTATDIIDKIIEARDAKQDEILQAFETCDATDKDLGLDAPPIKKRRVQKAQTLTEILTIVAPSGKPTIQGTPMRVLPGAFKKSTLWIEPTSTSSGHALPTKWPREVSPGRSCRCPASRQLVMMSNRQRPWQLIRAGFRQLLHRG